MGHFNKLFWIACFVVAIVFAAMTISKSRRPTDVSPKPAEASQDESPHALAQPAAENETIAASRIIEQTKPTELSLILVGTVISSAPQGSLAMIKDSQEHMASAFKTGNKVTGLAEILEIQRDVVYLRNLSTNQKEFLTLAPFDPRLRVTQEALNSSATRKEFNLSRSAVDEQLGDLAKILNEASSRPVNRNGQIVGYQLTWIKPDSVLSAQLGLQPGDIIKTVNGSPVGSAEAALRIFKALRDSSYIELETERAGRTTTLIYSVRK